MSTRIYSPIVRGSGVSIIHDALAEGIEGYRVKELSSYAGVFPVLNLLRRREPAAITHITAEFGPWIAHPDSRVVATFHNYYLDRELQPFATPSQRLFYQTILRGAVAASLRRASVITAVSRFIADLVAREHAPGERLVCLPNGIDTSQFVPKPRESTGEIRVLFAGNPTRRKGAQHLSALAEALPPDVLIRYTGALRSSAVMALDEQPKLQKIPRVAHSQMHLNYQDSDIFFFPTVREGFGLVVAEAMACGLPVVATNCSSMPELVVHGKGGFLFEPGNRAQMLEHLLRLSRDPVLRQEMGAFNRERIVRDFPLDRMVKGYRDVFEHLSR